jgi:N utilization substance protein B
MIYQWQVGGGPPEKVVEDYFGRLARDKPSAVDPFAVRLFRSVTDDAAELDEIIRRHASRWSLERMSLVVRYLLRLAIAELRARQTPATVIINEALEIGKRFAGDESTGFLNGVLEAARKEFAQASKTGQAVS